MGMPLSHVRSISATIPEKGPAVVSSASAPSGPSGVQKQVSHTPVDRMKDLMGKKRRTDIIREVMSPMPQSNANRFAEKYARQTQNSTLPTNTSTSLNSQGPLYQQQQHQHQQQQQMLHPGLPIYGQPPMGGYVLQPGMGMMPMGGYYPQPQQAQTPALKPLRQVQNEAATKISRQFKRFKSKKNSRELSSLNPMRLNSVAEDEENESPKSEKMVFDSHLGGSSASAVSRTTTNPNNNNKATGLHASRDSTTEEN